MQNTLFLHLQISLLRNLAGQMLLFDARSAVNTISNNLNIKEMMAVNTKKQELDSLQIAMTMAGVIKTTKDQCTVPSHKIKKSSLWSEPELQLQN